MFFRWGAEIRSLTIAAHVDESRSQEHGMGLTPIG